MAVFALLDEWIAATGRTDPWLELGLELTDSWQAAPPREGQQHLASLLSVLTELRTEPAAHPDPLVLALWFHHTAPARVGDALAEVGGPELAHEVTRLVRGMEARVADVEDASGLLLCRVHRTVPRVVHLAAVPRPTGDQ